MARQTFYLDRAVRHPLYKTRMLQAGPLALDASAARLYRKLGVKLLDENPKDVDAYSGTARESIITAKPKVSAVKDVKVIVRAEKEPAKKAAPRKRSRRKAKAKAGK